MKLDVKIPLYLFLAYALYGVTYLFSDGVYVVPLPMLFILVPIVSVFFIITTKINKFSIFFLLIPLSLMSDKISQYNVLLSDYLTLLSIFSFAVLGIFLIFDGEFKSQAKLNILH